LIALLPELGVSTSKRMSFRFLGHPEFQGLAATSPEALALVLAMDRTARPLAEAAER
jgi:hypothetical protein